MVIVRPGVRHLGGGDRPPELIDLQFEVAVGRKLADRLQASASSTR
jgi:hypothetical protein